MKYLLRWGLLFLFGVLFGANLGFNFTKDLSIQAVEEVMVEAYSGVLETYSGSLADDMLVDFQKNMKLYYQTKKDQIAEDLRRSFGEYIKEKLNQIF